VRITSADCIKVLRSTKNLCWRCGWCRSAAGGSISLFLHLPSPTICIPAYPSLFLLMTLFAPLPVAKTGLRAFLLVSLGCDLPAWTLLVVNDHLRDWLCFVSIQFWRIKSLLLYYERIVFVSDVRPWYTLALLVSETILAVCVITTNSNRTTYINPLSHQCVDAARTVD